MPVVLVVTVSARLPGLLGAAGWRAVSADRPVLALPGAAASADVLRREGIPVEHADVAAADARPDDVVCLAAPEEASRFPGVPVVGGAPEPVGSSAPRPSSNRSPMATRCSGHRRRPSWSVGS